MSLVNPTPTRELDANMKELRAKPSDERNGDVVKLLRGK